jgi:hypothetical protein
MLQQSPQRCGDLSGGRENWLKRREHRSPSRTASVPRPKPHSTAFGLALPARISPDPAQNAPASPESQPPRASQEAQDRQKPLPSYPQVAQTSQASPESL